MSKTAGNAIGVDEAPSEMFGQVMSLPDALIAKYFRLVTDVPLAEVDQIEAAMPAADGAERGQLKRRLARQIVTELHSEEAAHAAEHRFDVQFREHGVPDDVAEFDLGTTDPWFLPTLLVAAGLATSGSEARRLVSSGAVRLDGQVLREATAALPAGELRGRVIQVGKRRFARCVRS
jgi:tyrosyl-tRNA synthetase